MGTNFYGRLDGEEVHIGKRSAAGLYCWDCGVTLCRGGDSKIHYGRGVDREWHKQCPRCSKRRSEETLETSTAGRELGFNKSKPARKTGVATCSSFSWAIEPLAFRLGNIRGIKDEYGQRFTRKAFEAMMLECPIEYMDSIGQDFS